MYQVFIYLFIHLFIFFFFGGGGSLVLQFPNYVFPLTYRTKKKKKIPGLQLRNIKFNQNNKQGKVDQWCNGKVPQVATSGLTP